VLVATIEGSSKIKIRTKEYKSMEDANSEIFEVQTTPILEFNGATVENLVEKVNNNTS
jgi:hypothetical protein